MRNIRLVALDVDGTLVGKDLQIPPLARAALAEIRERGVRVAIFTGRMYQSAVPYAQELGLEEMPLVAYNGALVREYPSGRTLAHEPVPLEVCRSLAAYCEAHAYHLHAYVDDRLFVPDMGARTQEYLSIARVEANAVGSLFFWFNQPSTKLLLIDDPARMSRIQSEVHTLLGSSVATSFSYPQFLEIVSSRVSKGAALANIAASLGIAREEVLAMGDGMNDVPMLTWAGTSFAMAHAPEAVRKVATHTTHSGPGDGVVEALRKMGLVAVSSQ